VKSIVRPALVCFILLSLLTGVAYPLAVWGLARATFPWETSGSIVMQNGHTVGSALIGQQFSDPRHFWGRPSATGPFSYNAAASSGSNLGPLNPALTDAVKARIEALRAADPGNTAPVPVDLVTSSGSGVDPHISVAAAYYQAARVARLRALAPDRVHRLIDGLTERQMLGFLGEPRVNLLKLNLALDELRP
jgi:K+-transporting ATPase ATPase C chain